MAPPHKVGSDGFLESSQSRSERKEISRKINSEKNQFNHLDPTHPGVDDELEGNDRGGVEVGEDVAVGEEDGGVELEDELAKDRGDNGADEEAADVEKRPGVHQEVNL